jgi:hypothetical protein
MVLFAFFRPSAALLLRKKLRRFFLVSARIHLNTNTLKGKTRARIVSLIISSDYLKYRHRFFIKTNIFVRLMASRQRFCMNGLVELASAKHGPLYGQLQVVAEHEFELTAQNPLQPLKGAQENRCVKVRGSFQPLEVGMYPFSHI